MLGILFSDSNLNPRFSILKSAIPDPLSLSPSHLLSSILHPRLGIFAPTALTYAEKNRRQ
jgi:hypothetical protein